MVVRVAEDDEVGLDARQLLEVRAVGVEVLIVRVERAAVYKRQFAPVHLRLDLVRLGSHVLQQLRIDAVPATSRLAPGAEQHSLVVAQHVAGVALSQQRQHLVRETELVDGVAGADQLIDRAHQFDRLAQPLEVAMDIGDDAEFHVSSLASGERGWEAALRQLDTPPARNRIAAGFIPQGDRRLTRTVRKASPVYRSSIVIVSITSPGGRLEPGSGFRGVICSTTSMPSVTRPNTVKVGSSCVWGV